MGDSTLNVNLMLDSRIMTVPYNNSTTAEDVCIYICKQLNISPLTRHIFALRLTGKSLFLMPSSTFGEKPTTLDFRVRFKVADTAKLLKLDINTYNYYFQQARNDLLENKIPDITFARYGKVLWGLGTTDMYRVMLEKGISKDCVMNDYKKYFPKEAVKKHSFFIKNSFFIKKPIRDNLSKLEKCDCDASYVKAEYLAQLENIAPEYLSETYKAIMKQDGNDYRIILKLSPYDPIKPGLKYCMEFKKDEQWQLICSIEDLNVISFNNNINIVISRMNGIPFYVRFHSKAVMYSFISLLDGYYRLTCKWTYSICREVETPSLQKLYSMKCHGPVGGEFSYAKLEAKLEARKKLEEKTNLAGCFIVRESETKYNHYYIDVCVKEGLKPKTFKLEKIIGEEFIFNDDLTRYKNIHQVMAAHNDPNGDIYLHECLPPSDYDDSPLLLCKSENMMGDTSTDSSVLCIDYKDLQVYKDHKKEGSRGITVVFRSMWKVAKGKKTEVAMKMLKKEPADHYLKDILTVAGQWAFLQSNVLERLYGIAFISNISLVLEYFPLGPLDKFLRENRAIMRTVDLIQAASNLGAALFYLTEKKIVHGKIRCRKLMVKTHDANTFTIKLVNPGVHTSYASSEVHWIPIECYSNLNNAKISSEADVWSFGTTLWEIFTLGEEIAPIDLGQVMRWYISGKRLPKPPSCSNEIYTIMKECWEVDPHKRKKPQAIMRDISQILYQVYDSTQAHTYETVFKKRPNITSSRESLTSVVTEPVFDNSIGNEHSGGTSVSVIDKTCPDRYDDSDSYDVTNIQPKFTYSMATISVDNLNSIFELDEYCDVILQGRIGQGFYGEVYKGSLEYLMEQNKEPKMVAVKKLKATALSSSCLQDFEREINIMKSLNHPNIVKILGVKREPEIYLVMEFVQHGSLQSYLKIYRESLQEGQLLNYALDIAKGMDYLGRQNIVHRDLAARNILVVDENHVKISDFGLAQVMNTNDYYILKTPDRELPIKWYAPESLRDWKFSTRSDVWSYGVTMCEMFNYGEQPNLTNIDNPIEGPQQQILLTAIERGARFPCPPDCPKAVYVRIIYPCWQADPHRRPSFAELRTEIENLLSQ